MSVRIDLYDEGADRLRVVATRTFAETVETLVPVRQEDGSVAFETAQSSVEREEQFVAHGWVSALVNHYDDAAYAEDGQLRDPAQDAAVQKLHEAELELAEAILAAQRAAEGDLEAAARVDAASAEVGRLKTELADAELNALPGVGKPRAMTDGEVRAYVLALLAEQAPGFAETLSPADLPDAAPLPLRSFEV